MTEKDLAELEKLAMAAEAAATKLAKHPQTDEERKANSREFAFAHDALQDAIGSGNILYLIAEIKRLREALKLFADKCEGYGQEVPDDHPVASCDIPTVGDLRAARDALKEKP